MRSIEGERGKGRGEKWQGRKLMGLPYISASRDAVSSHVRLQTLPLLRVPTISLFLCSIWSVFLSWSLTSKFDSSHLVSDPTHDLWRLEGSLPFHCLRALVLQTHSYPCVDRSFLRGGTKSCRSNVFRTQSFSSFTEKNL